MAKVTALSDLGKIKDLETYIRFTSGFLSEVQSIINGKIEFGSNIPAETQTVFFPIAAQDLTLNHTLGKSSINYLVAQKTGPCDIYNGTVATTSSTVTLQSTTAGVTVTLILY